MTPPALGALMMLSAVVAGCGRCDGAGTAPLGSSADAAVAALQIEVSGCAAVRRGPVCELDAAHRELVLWIDAVTPDTPVEIRSNGALLSPTSTRDGAGGKTVAVVVPSGAGDLTASVSREGARRERRLSLEEVAPEDTLTRVRALRKEGKLDEAAAAMPAWSTFSEAHRARARSLAARLALAAGRVDDAIIELRAAMAMHRAEGRVSDEVLDAMALAHTLLTHGRRIAEAREVLDGVAPALADWDEGRAQMGYYRALVSRDAGDIRGALRALRDSQRATERLGLLSFARTISEASARLYQMSGEHERAVAVHRTLEAQQDERTPACERARVAGNVLWSDLAMRGATLPAIPSMTKAPSASGNAMRSNGGSAQPGATSETAEITTRVAALEQALASCTRKDEKANGRTTLALAALVVGDVAGAEAEVRAARAGGTPPAFVAEWLLDIEARIALAREDTRGALQRYDELAARAEAARSPEAAWRAALGRGVALETAGDRARAEKAYRAAEGMLDEQGAQVPLNDGRAGFLAERDRSARHLADLLLRRGDALGAWEVVRRARSRALRSTQRLDHVAALAPDVRLRWEQAMARYAVERDALEKTLAEAWSVPSDQLETFSTARRAREDRARAALDDAFAALGEAQPRLAELSAPAAGDLELAFQPSADGRRLHVLARTSARTRVATVDALPPGASDDTLAEALLGAFDSEIEQAKRIRVFDYGPLAAVDLHALPWRHAPLLAHAPVEYPTDIGPRVPASGAPAEDRRALVVFDTRGDLPQSRAEAEAVRGALADAWETHSLQGSAATRSAVTDAMGRVGLFHFASHASFDDAEVWDSALALADGGLLRAGDVLAQQRTPELVVLSGCDTGRAGQSRVADMSVARAFVARGSRIVVATSRPVEDELAATLLAKTYAGASSKWDLAQSLRSAQLEASRSAPASDWRAYRIITP